MQQRPGRRPCLIRPVGPGAGHLVGVSAGSGRWGAGGSGRLTGLGLPCWAPLSLRPTLLLLLLFRARLIALLRPRWRLLCLAPLGALWPLRHL